MYSRALATGKLLAAVQTRLYPGFASSWARGCGVTGRSLRHLCTVELNNTVDRIIEQWSNRFQEQNIPEPVESIKHILSCVTGGGKISMDTDELQSSRGSDRLTQEQMEKLEALCECRLSRMPIQYIIGEWDFRDITLKCTPPVFIPRPETEILVDVVLKRLKESGKKNWEILDVGCGSGAISLAIAHSCKQAKCTAIDANAMACDLTRENRDRLGLQDRVSIFHGSLDDEGSIVDYGVESAKLNERTFDFVVSNPPYIRTSEIPRLPAEIKIFEDVNALNGGEDGLNIIKALLKFAAVSLKPGGRLILEVDPRHPEYIQFFTQKYLVMKLQYEHTHKDFCNEDRFVEIVKM